MDSAATWLGIVVGVLALAVNYKVFAVSGPQISITGLRVIVDLDGSGEGMLEVTLRNRGRELGCIEQAWTNLLNGSIKQTPMEVEPSKSVTLTFSGRWPPAEVSHGAHGVGPLRVAVVLGSGRRICKRIKLTDMQRIQLRLLSQREQVSASVKAAGDRPVLQLVTSP